MTQFRVGLSTQLLRSRFSPTALARADLINAKASGVELGTRWPTT